MQTSNKKPQSVPRLNAILAWALFALSVVMLLISGGLQMFSNFQTQQEAISQRQQLIAQDASRQVSSFIQEKFSVLETAVRLTELTALPAEEQEKTLSSMLGLHLAFRQLVLLDDREEELAMVSRLSQAASGHLTDQLSEDAWEQIKEQERYISPVYVDSVTNEPMVILAVPESSILGEFQGTLVAEVNLKFMWDLVNQLQIGDQGLAYVVDRQGNLIAFSDTARVLKGENVSQLQVVGEFIDNPPSTQKDAMSLYPGIKGITVVGTYVPLETPDWAVITEVPWGEAYREVVREAALSLGIILFMAVMAGLLGISIARRLVVPLVKLTETATRIARGERTLQAEVGGPWEVVSLATAFNSMTSQLQDLIGNLEQRVAERTAELEQKALDLTRVNQYKSEFLASMSHELRTPLNAILTFNELLSIGTFGPVNEEQVDYLQKSLQSGKHLLSLINDVLDVAKIQSGKMKLFVEKDFDIAAELKSIVASTAVLLKDKPITFNTDIDPEFPPMMCDKRRTRQVLLNLVSNAVKFTEQGSITLAAKQRGNGVLFSVSDTGPGIAPEDQPMIFEPFVQTEAGIQHAGGTGLGLPITKNLVEAHGGRIWLESTPGKGSTFYVLMPLKEGQTLMSQGAALAHGQ
jgi:signal transduction histidine kinase